MTLSDLQNAMLKGLVCPYCKRASTLTETKYGYMYVCAPCDARVGTHEGTTEALGRLANATLRKLKQEAHAHFDRLWREGYMRRKEAYRWLSQALNLPAEYTHIGMFSEATCEKVVAHSQRLYAKLQSTPILELIDLFHLVKTPKEVYEYECFETFYPRAFERNAPKILR